MTSERLCHSFKFANSAIATTHLLHLPSACATPPSSSVSSVTHFLGGVALCRRCAAFYGTHGILHTTRLKTFVHVMGDRYQPPVHRPGRPQYAREDHLDRYDDQFDHYDRIARRAPAPPPSSFPPARYDDRARGGGYTFRGAASRDTYQPEENFSFRASGPPAPRFPSPTRQVQPQKRSRQRGDQTGRFDHSRQGPPDRRGENARGYQHGRQRGRGYRPTAAHTREILHKRRASTPEQLYGMSVEGQAHFATVLSSSEDEAEEASSMDRTRDSELEEGEVPRKRVKTEAAVADEAAAAPKWSNPDPYTALPPTESFSAPKRDIVQVIRKAKVSAPTVDSGNAVKANDDFISFNFGGEYSDTNMSGESDIADNTHPPARTSLAQATVPRASISMYDIVGAPPPPPPGLIMPTDEELAVQFAGDTRGTKRKRAQQSKGRDDIIEEWESNGTNPTPWCIVDLSPAANTGPR